MKQSPLHTVLCERLGWGDREGLRRYFSDPAGWIEDLEWVERQVHLNYFKRIQAPPVIVLSKRAFGFDLRETQWPGYTPRCYSQLKERTLGMAL